MAKSVNKVILLGTLGRDAETKFLASGVSVTRLSVATERSWKDKESSEWKSETEWHNVTLWRKENLAQYLTKGSKVYIEGSLKTRKYDKDGQTHYSTEIIGEDVVFASSRPTGEAASSQSDEGNSGAGAPGEDDVPF